MYFSFVLIWFFCPQPQTTGEQKTKPTQSSVRELRGLGLSPDLVSPIQPSVCKGALCKAIVHCFGKFHHYHHIYRHSSRFVVFLFFVFFDQQIHRLILSRHMVLFSVAQYSTNTQSYNSKTFSWTSYDLRNHHRMT